VRDPQRFCNFTNAAVTTRLRACHTCILLIAHRRDNEAVGFIECSTQEGTKYGMGESVPEADVRPVISNLAVDARYRRYGIGSSLLRACEDAVKEWDYDEIVLQVEDDNVNAKAFYEKQGFHILFMDRAARRYDTSGFLLQNVRCTKITLRKVLPRTAGVNSSKSSTYSSNRGMSGMLAWFSKPFTAAQAQVQQTQIDNR
jgi:ribosomal protein S18 acetylase RimI-like enzyme